MKLAHLKLDRIGCYTEREFDFKNLTVVFGENRTGKSTLIYALYFALFGEHLSQGLSISDLCRKGCPSGSANLTFGQGQTRFRLRRSTAGMPSFYRQNQDAGGSSEWEAMMLSDVKALDAHLGISPQVASLTSFFREGELIYFLRDMPKYNKTLLQHLLKMDDIFIVQSRFHKAVTLAKEVLKKTDKDLGQITRPSEDAAVVEKKVVQLEKKLSEVETEYLSLIQSTGEDADPARYQQLKKQLEDVKGRLEQTSQVREKLVPLTELKARKATLEHRLKNVETDQARSLETRKADIQKKLGAVSARIKDSDADVNRLASLRNQPSCPVCGQGLSPADLTSMGEALQEDIRKWRVEAKELEGRLERILIQENALAENRKALENLTLQMEVVKRSDKGFQELETESDQISKALERMESKSGNHPDADHQLTRLKALETSRMKLQREVIDAKVTVARDREAFLREKQSREKRLRAERDHLICRVAHRALEDAIRSLNRELLSRVRQSLTEWSGYFTFLKEFDIGLTPNQFSPVIQAKGYQYKLNQMSKSERIFLYLMLKLAIGDALTHLGVFILDDPADGLDAKRKQMLASLLSQISSQRQVIVTTNDKDFAEMFPADARIFL